MHPSPARLLGRVVGSGETVKFAGMEKESIAPFLLWGAALASLLPWGKWFGGNKAKTPAMSMSAPMAPMNPGQMGAPFQPYNMMAMGGLSPAQANFWENLMSQEQMRHGAQSARSQLMRNVYAPAPRRAQNQGDQDDFGF